MPRRKIIFSGVLLFAVFVSLCSAISESEIQRLARVMNWKAGQVIADVGAGEGEIGFAAAIAVGETGKVYLTELDKEKIAALEKDASRRNLKNVAILAATEKETKLPDNCCDAIVLRRVYHHFTAPAEMDAGLLRSLRRGGLLAVIDFPPRKSLTASDPVKGVPSNRGGHGIPKKILVEELLAVGFSLDKTFDDWPEDSYCVLFRKR
ncbi:MAG TPA: methyltransferase domain-containing protein [Candidatus Acidoferrales bacterium]|jgi:SAM-dependent methyltransferase|nr:methyltransferase domain-containing protein [Candidatus Acidoferrales bacterium]